MSKNKIKSALIGVLLPLSSLASIASPSITISSETGTKDLLDRGFVYSDKPYELTQLDIVGDSFYGRANQRWDLSRNGANNGIDVAVGKHIKLEEASKSPIATIEFGHLAMGNGQTVPELYTSLEFKSPLNPKFEAVWSGGDVTGKYFSASLTKERHFGNFTAGICAKVGVHDHYGSDFFGLAHATIDGTISTPISSNLTAKLGLRLQYGLHKPVTNEHALTLNVAYKF